MKGCLRGDSAHFDDTGAWFCVVQNAVRSEVDASNCGCVRHTRKYDVSVGGQRRQACPEFGALGDQFVRLRAVVIVNHYCRSCVSETGRNSRTHVAEADPS